MAYGLGPIGHLREPIQGEGRRRKKEVLPSRRGPLGEFVANRPIVDLQSVNLVNFIKNSADTEDDSLLISFGQPFPEARAQREAVMVVLRANQSIRIQ